MTREQLLLLCDLLNSCLCRTDVLNEWQKNLNQIEHDLLRRKYRTFQKKLPFWVHERFINLIKIKEYDKAIECMEKNKLLAEQLVYLIKSWEAILNDWLNYRKHKMMKKPQVACDELSLRRPVPMVSLASSLSQRADSIFNVESCDNLVDLEKLYCEALPSVIMNGTPVNHFS